VSEVCPLRCGKIAGNFASDNQSPITPLAAAFVSCESSAGFCKFPKCGESASFLAYAKIPRHRVVHRAADYINDPRNTLHGRECKYRKTKKASRLLCWLRATKPICTSSHLRELHAPLGVVKFLIPPMVSVVSTVLTLKSNIAPIFHERRDCLQECFLVAGLAIVAEGDDVAFLVAGSLEREQLKHTEQITVLQGSGEFLHVHP